MQTGTINSGPGSHLLLVNDAEIQSTNPNPYRLAAHLLFPTVGIAVTGTALFVSVIQLSAGGTPQDLSAFLKPIGLVISGNLLTVALLERICGCFNDTMKELTANTLKGTCFPILALAGSFSLWEITLHPVLGAYRPLN